MAENTTSQKKRMHVVHVQSNKRKRKRKMSENIELDVSVEKVTEAKGEDRVITVALKGEKAVLIETASAGFELIDILDVKLTVKCGMNATIKQLGIEKYMNRKVIVLRDRDESLQSFGEMEPVPAEQQTIA